MKKKTIKYSAAKEEPAVLREVAVMSDIGEVISVRSAKAHLSALLDLVAGGREITITSDGKPKARLVSPMSSRSEKVFRGMGDYLLKQRIGRGVSADEIIRAERDSRP